MQKRVFSGIMLILLLIGLLTSIVNVQFSKAEEAMNIESELMGSVWIGTDWNKTYGGTGSDYAYSAVQTSDGGYALAGGTNSSGAGNYDFWLVKTDSAGIMQWNETYGGTGFDSAYTVVQTVDGGYVIVGSTMSFGAGGSDSWLVKTDSSGIMQWNKTYGGKNYDFGIRVIQTSDGGYALAGQAQSFGAGGGDFWLVKTDSSGVMQWNKTYGGTNSDYPNAMIQTTDGGYALAGSVGSLFPSYDSWLVKTDSSGIMQWNKTYGGTNYDVTWSVVQTADGGYALGGYISDDAGDVDMQLVNTDSSGNMLWNKTYGEADAEGAFSMVRTSDGGFALAGITNSSGAGNYDSCLVKTDSTGNMKWNKTYGGISLDTTFSVIQTSDLGFALAGATVSYGAGKEDFWLIKFTPQTIYILADGSVDPPTAPIQRNGDIYTLTDNIYTSATLGIVIERDSIILDGAGYTLQGNTNYTGIFLSGRSNVTIKNTRIEAFYDGIDLYFSSNNTIAGNNIRDNIYIGIWNAYSSGTNVSGNNITNNGEGIELYSSSNNNSISGNNVTTNEGAGIALCSSCNNNTIFGNNVTNNYHGIRLYDSANNIIAGNDATNNEGGILLQGSANNTISGNNITNNTYGILSWDSPSNIISGNTIATNNYDGIYLYESSDDTITGNNITGSNDCGINLYISSNTNVSGNNIANDRLGIYLYSASNNSISGNNITANNYYGIYLCSSSNNIFYHNNIGDNANQVYSLNSSNAWDDGYPSGGNYWNDYSGVDLCRGAYQNETGSDGIGDTNYTINVDNTDNYPLMGTFGTPTAEGENVTVFPTENVSLTFQNVTVAGSTTVNKTAVGPEPPLGFELAGQYYDIQTTVDYSGQIEVRIIYDDSNMSLLAEKALRLRQWNMTQWIDITTHVDTVNNVIYGVAPHLSMFGVTSFTHLPDEIAVIDSVCSKTVVGEGCDVIVNVTVRNQGGSTKTFDVFTYADAIVIGKQTVIDLAPSAQVTVTFTWSTSGCAKGIYTVSVSDQLISLVTVTIPGDVDGTFEVDIYDITAICVCYNSEIGSPLYYPNCDIDGNGVIDIYDVTTACITYGQTYP
jgi:parallel beta-helix repeat protein